MSAQTEALTAFGDGTVFVEPYIEGGRHVEVQVLADAHGTVWVLGTRDCSLQRRHQKVIEEAPAPGLSPELTDELHTLAVRAAKATDYRGAGTVEFLVADAKAHFLEMNTRLQVEHPVTEAVFGVDLVALQVRIAEGEALPPTPPAPQGHAIEARLYAEDPAAGWAPQTGTIHQLALDGVRLDSGYAAGDTIGVHYDPMLAKAVAHAPTRAEAARKLARALERARIHGPATNRDLLVRSLRHPEFADGPTGAGFRLDTGFYDRNLPELTTPTPGAHLAALAAALADAASGRAGSAAAGVTYRRNRRSNGTASTRSATGSPATASKPTAAPRCASTPPSPVVSGSKSAVWYASSPSRDTAVTPSTSTRRPARTPSPPTPASPTPATSSRPARCSPPCRVSSCGSPTASRRAVASPPDSRCSGWRP